MIIYVVSPLSLKHQIMNPLRSGRQDGEQQVLDEFLLNEKPFLRHRYSLRDLSEETGIAMHQLSAFLNKRQGINFNDFINQYRVRYCLEFLNRSLIKKVNLSELSSMCGFNNRNTFTTSFKKVTGETPSEFIRKIHSPAS